MPDALRWFLPAFFLVLGLACPVVAEWIRHRPERLTQGTQHIVLLGLLGLLVFQALALVTLVLLSPLR